MRAGEAVPQFPGERIRVIAEGDRAKAPSVAATSTEPSELLRMAKRIEAPAPPLRYAVGVIPQLSGGGLVKTAAGIEPAP